MNLLNTRTALLALLLSASTIATAQDGHPRGPHSARGIDPAPFMSQMHHALKSLDLSADQRELIHEIMQQNRDSLSAHRLAAVENRQLLHEVITASAFDEEQLAVVAETEGQLAAERVMLMGNIARQVLAQLDDEQIDRLQAMREQRGDRPRRHSLRRLDGADPEPVEG